jgi:SPP1 family predicted phage head-tail adaptor
MLFSDVINLVKITSAKNDYFDIVQTETKRQVYANKKSIKMSEFYQAQVVGMKPELVFEIWASEYDGEEYIEFDGVKYKIIRTYMKNVDILELVVSRGVI